MIDKEKRDDCNFLLSDLGRVDKEFKDFLIKKDPFYIRKIYPILSYSSSEGYYTIKIIDSGKNFNINIKDYFEKTFKSEPNSHELEALLDRNHVKLII